MMTKKEKYNPERVYKNLTNRLAKIERRLESQEKLYFKLDLFLKDINQKLWAHQNTVGLHKEDKENE